MTRERAYYNSELILLDYYIWQNLDNQTKEFLLQGVQIGIDQIYDAHEAELKAKDEQIAELKAGAKNYAETYAKQLAAKDKKITELQAMVQNMCAECECAKFADNAIKPSEMWKLHTMLKDNK